MATPSRERAESRPGLTPRAVVLAVVAVGVAVSIALPVRELVAQRSQIASLQSQNAHEVSRLGELQALEAKWSNPYFVKQQARSRLFWVMPGEQAFTVIGKSGQPDPAPSPVTAWQPVVAQTQPWYSTLWASVQRAGAARTS